MGFLAFFNCYTLRVNLSVAIVAMVNATYLRQVQISAADGNSSITSLSQSRDDRCANNDVNATNAKADTVYATPRVQRSYQGGANYPL